ncbi:MAG: hypothetical protein HKN47_20625, partial [Pirellulaceae bacterium]|nr:hypothetical protein [Pirellulaceae bacterium]
RKATTLSVGQPIAIPIEEFSALAESSMDASVSASKNASKDSNKVDSARYTLETPGETEVSIKPTDGSTPELLWNNTGIPGTYHFRRIVDAGDGPVGDDSGVDDSGVDDSGGDDPDNGVVRTLRVVEVPDVESELSGLAVDRLSSLASTVDAKVYTTLAQLQSDDRTRRFGQEIWRWLLAALLVAMIVELFLQQRLVSRRASVEAS